MQGREFDLDEWFSEDNILIKNKAREVCITQGDKIYQKWCSNVPDAEDKADKIELMISKLASDNLDSAITRNEEFRREKNCRNLLHDIKAQLVNIEEKIVTLFNNQKHDPSDSKSEEDFFYKAKQLSANLIDETRELIKILELSQRKANQKLNSIIDLENQLKLIPDTEDQRYHEEIAVLIKNYISHLAILREDCNNKIEGAADKMKKLATHPLCQHKIDKMESAYHLLIQLRSWWKKGNQILRSHVPSKNVLIRSVFTKRNLEQKQEEWLKQVKIHLSTFSVPQFIGDHLISVVKEEKSNLDKVVEQLERLISKKSKEEASPAPEEQLNHTVM